MDQKITMVVFKMNEDNVIIPTVYKFLNNIILGLLTELREDKYVAMIFIKVNNEEYKCIDDKLIGYNKETICQMNSLRNKLIEQLKTIT